MYMNDELIQHIPSKIICRDLSKQVTLKQIRRPKDA
jgi:hypothetical protein